MGKLPVEHEAVRRGVAAAGQMEGACAWDGNVIWPDQHARQSTRRQEHLLLQRRGRVLVQLRVRVRAGRAREGTGPPSVEVRSHHPELTEVSKPIPNVAWRGGRDLRLLLELDDRWK